MRTETKTIEIRGRETEGGRQRIVCPSSVMYHLLSVICLLFLAGCRQPEPALAHYGAGVSPESQTNWQKFPSADRKETTAVESAIALSDKYAKLSGELSALRQARQSLDEENRKLKEDLQTCRGLLEQAQKELDEVNDLLVEMRLELNNWKNDVLGFRDEMRDAEKAQLEALLKVLKLLGGDIRTDGNQPAKQD